MGRRRQGEERWEGFMKGFGREGVNGQREGHFWGLQYFYKNAALSWNPNISFFLDQRLVTMSMKPGQ